MIEGKRIPYEDLIKLYADKCKYCDTLEERLAKSNKRNDELVERINSILIKGKKVKDRYKQLYDFAESLTKIIDERDKDIKSLVDVNKELRKTIEQLQNSLKVRSISQITALEILRNI